MSKIERIIMFEGGVETLDYFSRQMGQAFEAHGLLVFYFNLEEKGVKERREQQVTEKNESREAVSRAGVEANTAVKDAGKAERKPVAQKRALTER